MTPVSKMDIIRHNHKQIQFLSKWYSVIGKIESQYEAKVNFIDTSHEKLFIDE